MKDSGFIQKSRKVDFDTIAAPATGDADLDELDAFADTIDEVDVTKMGLKVNPVSSTMTTLNSADAEDLRAFIEAERRRKHLYGSDDEVEEVEVQNQESEVVEHEIVDLVSEDELDNWDVDESNIVVFKQDVSDIRSSISNFRSPSIRQAKSENLRKSPRKRDRVSSDFDDLSCLDQPPTVCNITGELKHIFTFYRRS